MIGLGLSIVQLAVRQQLAFNPASFFANGEQGWWYDPSNFATLFQDSAGTTPVTAVEQPVGLQLDLSKGLVLGPELVVNGDFATNTGWVTPAGISISGGGLNFSNSSDGAYQNAGIQAGKFYRVTMTITRSAGSVGPAFNGSPNTIPTTVATSGTFSWTFAPTGTANGNFSILGSAFTGTIDNVTVKELPGNHRFQSTSANRPVVSARVNLLTKTEQFDDAAWTKLNTTITANSIAAPNGTLTADTLTTSAGGLASNVQQLTTKTTGVTYTLSTFAKRGNVKRVLIGQQFSISGFSDNIFDLETKTWVLQGAGTTVSFSELEDGWLQLNVSIAATGTGSFASFIGPINDNGTAFNSTTAGNTIYIWGADLRPTNQGVNLPVYQRVNTSTDYDSTGFPVYIKPNGSNQSLATNSINFTATNSMTVWQGIRKLTDVGTGIITELSPAVGANNGSFYLIHGSGSGNFTATSQGTAVSSVSTPTGALPAPVTVVSSLAMQISIDQLIVRINGAQVASGTSDQGTGNYGNYPAYFYARAGTSLFFNGNDYGSIARGAASTAAQIANGEAYINSKTKAYTP
jgi:hypothetical protein